MYKRDTFGLLALHSGVVSGTLRQKIFGRFNELKYKKEGRKKSFTSKMFEEELYYMINIIKELLNSFTNFTVKDSLIRHYLYCYFFSISSVIKNKTSLINSWYHLR